MIFLVPNVEIFVSSTKFAVTEIERCWFQIWQFFLKILAQKYSTYLGILVQNLDILFPQPILQLEEFEGEDLKYDHSIFKNVGLK